MYKQVIIINKEIKMSAGKMAAQTAHASLGAFLRSKNQEWLTSGMKKVIVKGEDLEHLQKRAGELGIPSFLVSDAGLTELEPGTVTALGLGPAREGDIDKLTKALILL